MMSNNKFKLETLLLILCVGCMVTRGAVAGSLPPVVSNFGGSFEVEDPGVPNSCATSNDMSGSCACPGGTRPAYSFHIINDSVGTGKQHGGVAKFCSSGLPQSGSEFAGGYQLDDPVAGGESCRIKNAVTGACSCPLETHEVHIRTLAYAAGKIVGSTIHLCMRHTTAPAVFGGAYQVDDSAPGSLGCRSANPYTGSCGCPVGFKAQAHRVQVDAAKGFIGSNFYTCMLPAIPRHLCPGLLAESGADMVDASGGRSANIALQKCLDAVPKGGVLEIPAGNYRIDEQVRVMESKTIRTQGMSDVAEGCLGTTPCATLFAGPSLHASGGMLTIKNTSNVVLDHIVLDGNRFARIGTKAYEECKAGHNIWGFNASAENCASCSFTNSATINALCGSGFEWTGAYATIHNSVFQDNGDHFDSRVWSDGLTLKQSNDAVVTNNQFIDNSDVGFISGGGNNAQYKNNVVLQRGMAAFAGFMLDNFNGGTSGDFSGAEISGNEIRCDQGKCLYAMNLGPHAWYQSKNIMGGTVVSNKISGGTIALNVDGAGTPDNPVFISGNTLATEPDPSAPHTPPCKSLKPGLFSASADSSLRPGSSAPSVVQSVHGCVGQTSW